MIAESMTQDPELRARKVSHTPGPWAVCGATFIWSPEAKANVAAASELRATTTVEYTRPGIGSDDFGEICANARLISAAPDLLAALEAVLADRAYQRLTGAPHFTSAPTEQEWKEESRRKAWGLVEAAIAKARGE